MSHPEQRAREPAAQRSGWAFDRAERAEHDPVAPRFRRHRRQSHRRGARRAAAPRAAFRQHTSPRRAARGSGCFKVRLAVQPNRRMAGRVSNEGSSDSVRTAIQTQAFTQHCSAESPAAYLAASSAFTQMEHFRSQTSRRSLFWLLASLPRPLRRELGLSVLSLVSLHH